MIRSRKWFRGFPVALLVFLGIFISSCEQSVAPPPSEDPGELSLSGEAQSASQIAWQTLNYATTHRQFSGIVSGGSALFSDDPNTLNSQPELRRAATALKGAAATVRRSGRLSKTTADTLIWYEEWNDPLSGTAGRRALYYDPLSGIGRVYQTIYRFPDQVRLRYDSTEARIDFGTALEDSSDDRLLSIAKLSRFAPDYFIEEVRGAVTVTDYDAENQISGAIATNQVDYGSQTELRQLQQRAELNPEGSGHFTETLHYRDDTRLRRTVNIYPDNTGDFAEVWRDGSTAEGTFDLFEDDNHGSVTRTVHFKQHPFLIRLENSAAFTLDPADSSSTAILTEKRFYRSGDLDTSRVEVQRRFEEGYWREYFTIETLDEGTSAFVIIYKEGFREIEGEFTDPENIYVRFNGVEYEDGSGELWLRVYASREAFDTGQPPLLTLHIRFGPDGSGEGELREGERVYQVTYHRDGQIEIRDEQGRREVLNAYGE